VTGLGAAVNIVTNIILIPIMGIMGAALATLFAYMAMAGALYWQSQKVYFIKYDWRRVGFVGMLVLIGFFIDYSFVSASLNLTEKVLIKFALLLAITVILFLTGFFSKGEIETLKSVVRVRRAQRFTSENSLPEPLEASEERREGQ
jgi:O-antigen/teichoic acid export membrane protein